MTLKDQLDALLDATVFDSTGTKVGAVRQVYVDDASGKITFATVSTGIFSSDAIVPLHGARLLDDELHVDHTRSVIRDSPRPDHTEDALTPDQEVKLLEYYGIEAPVRGQEAAPSRPRSAAPAGGTSESQARESTSPGSRAPESRTPAEKHAGTKAGTTPEKRPEKRPEKKPETSPGTAGGRTPGTTATKKTDDPTTTSSPKPEVGENRKPAKPGGGAAPDTARPAAPANAKAKPEEKPEEKPEAKGEAKAEAKAKDAGAPTAGGTDTRTTRPGGTRTTGSGSGEPQGEGGSVPSPDHG